MIRVRLRENLGLRFTEEGCEIHGPRGIKIKDPHGRHRAFLQLLFDVGVPLAGTQELAGEERALLQTLSEKKLLRRHEDDYTRDEIWLSHFVADARLSLAGLAAKKVLIVGCGGTGAIVADHLARAGVKNFALVDGARLDAPDLNRQWTYSRDGIGQAKVDLLAAHLQSLGGTCEKFERQLQSAADLAGLPKADLIVCAADKPRFVIENLMLELADKENTPLLFGSVGITDDFVGEVLDSPQG